MIRILGAVLALVALVTACDVSIEESHEMKSTGSSKTNRVKPLSEIQSGYQAATSDWSGFLDCWSTTLGLPKAPRAAHELTRANGKFPPSYRHFVEATGGRGWVLPGDKKRYGDDRPQLLPIDDVGALKKVSKATWKAWTDNKIGRDPSEEKYYDYTSQQDEGAFREQYLDSLVLVGDLGHGAVLALNPAESSADGEWEAWYLSTKLPGALRFRSFAELMQLIYYMDLYPDRDTVALSARDFANSCAASIYSRFRE